MNVPKLRARLSEFKGLFLPNKFNVVISTPFLGESESLNVLARNVNLSGETLTTFEKVDAGHPKAVVSNFSNETLSISFLLTNDMRAEKFFRNWKNLIINKRTQSVSYRQDVIGTIVVEMLDRNNNIVQTRTFTECIPTSFSGWSLGSDAALTEITINFEFYEMITE